MSLLCNLVSPSTVIRVITELSDEKNSKNVLFFGRRSEVLTIIQKERDRPGNQRTEKKGWKDRQTTMFGIDAVKPVLLISKEYDSFNSNT